VPPCSLRRREARLLRSGGERSEWEGSGRRGSGTRLGLLTRPGLGGGARAPRAGRGSLLSGDLLRPDPWLRWPDPCRRALLPLARALHARRPELAWRGGGPAGRRRWARRAAALRGAGARGTGCGEDRCGRTPRRGDGEICAAAGASAGGGGGRFGTETGRGVRAGRGGDRVGRGPHMVKGVGPTQKMVTYKF